MQMEFLCMHGPETEMENRTFSMSCQTIPISFLSCNMINNFYVNEMNVFLFTKASSGTLVVVVVVVVVLFFSIVGTPLFQYFTNFSFRLNFRASKI